MYTCLRSVQETIFQTCLKNFLKFLNSIPLLAILLQKSLSAHIIMEILKTNFQ